MDLKKCFMDIVNSGNNENIHSLACMFEDSMQFLHNHDTEFYKSMKNKLYVLSYGEHLNEDMAKDWVSKMNFGEGNPMTKEQTDALAKNGNINFDNMTFNCWDWYAVVNLAVATMYKHAQKVEDYFHFAMSFFTDMSAKSGKAYNYYTYIVK